MSMGTGPGRAGHDLALTETLVTVQQHRLRVEVGTEAGAAVRPAYLRARPARPLSMAAAVAGGAAMGGPCHSPACASRWRPATAPHAREDVASRRRSCGNCTLACPTCFCTTVKDVTDRRATMPSLYTGPFVDPSYLDLRAG